MLFPTLYPSYYPLHLLLSFWFFYNLNSVVSSPLGFVSGYVFFLTTPCMIHVCMICLYMCPCYGTCVWVKEQHWVLVPIFCCVWDIVSFLVCQCMLHASWSRGYAESLVSASHWRGSAGVIDPLHQIQLCVIMGIRT